MKLSSFMRMGELLAQQPVLSGAVVFGVCVCCCVSTRVVQTCAVTLRGSVGSTRRVIHPNITIYTPGRVHTKQDDLWAKQPVAAHLPQPAAAATALAAGLAPAIATL
jgi:hypothetical protein